MKTPFKYYILTLIGVYSCIGSFAQYVSSSQEILSKERFIADSLTCQLLLSKLKQAEAKISIVLSDMDAKSKKDPFETSVEYSNRIEMLKARKDSLINSGVGDLKSQIKVLGQNIYRNNPVYQAKLLLDVNKYNADVEVWYTELLMNNKRFSVELNLDPSEAKLLWIAKDQIAIFGLKELPGIFYNGLEIVYGLPVRSLFLDAYPIEKLKDDRTGSINQEKNNEGIYDDNFLPDLEHKGINPSEIQEAHQEIVFEKVEIDAEFPGGTAGWTRYATREIERNIDELQDDGRSGTVVILFIVDKEGSVSEVRALPCGEAGVPNCLGPGTKLAEIATVAIKKGPKWKPAVQNGRQVKAYRRQPVTFQLAE